MLNLTLYPNRKYSGPFLNTSVSLLLLLAMNHLMYVHVQVHTQLLTGNFTFYTLAYIFMTYLANTHIYMVDFQEWDVTKKHKNMCWFTHIQFNSILFYNVLLKGNIIDCIKILEPYTVS